jgi:hypothetical protein
VATIVNDDYSSYTIGSAPAGNWVEEDGGTNWKVQAAPSPATGRVISQAQNNTADDWIKNTWTRQTSGLITISSWLRTGTAVGSANNRWGICYVYDGASTIVAGVSLLGDNLYLLNTTVNTPLFAPAANTIYVFDLTLNLSTGKITQIVVNGTTYNNGGSGWGWYTSTGTPGGVDRIRLSNFSTIAGQSVYLGPLDVATASRLRATCTTDAKIRSVSNSATCTTDAKIVPGGTLRFSGTNSGVACGCNKYSEVTLVWEGTGGTRTIERSNNGSAWSDVTSAGHIAVTTVSGNTVKIVDRRPQYGSSATTFGGNVYYRVRETENSTAGAYSTSSAIVADVNQTQAILAICAQISGVMAGTYIPSQDQSSPTNGEAYAGYPMVAMALGYYLSGTAQYATDVQNQFNYIKNTLTNSAGLIVFGSPYNDHIYRDHHTRTLMHAALASRLLRQAGNTTLADTIIAQCDVWGKAVFDSLNSGTPTEAITRSGWDASNSYFGLPVWQTGHAYAKGARVQPTAITGRVYEATNAGTSSGGEPTWPTTVGGTVTGGGGIVWKCVRSNTPWQASHTYTAGDIVIPTTANGRTYRAQGNVAQTFTSGSSEPVWPTSTAGTVTDGGVTWKETTVTASILYSTYQLTAPYMAVADGGSYDMNQVLEGGAAYALLMTDPSSAFYAAGTYRTKANTLVTDAVKLLTPFQVSDGLVPIGDPIQPSDGRVMYDTLYGGYTVQTAAAIYYLLGNVTSDLASFVDRAANWFLRDYAAEPVDYRHYTTATNILFAEVSYRSTGMQILGKTDPLVKLPFTAAFVNSATDKITDYTVNGAGTAVPDKQQAHGFDLAFYYSVLRLATVTTDAIVLTGQSATCTTDAKIVGHNTATVTTDAVIISGSATARTVTVTTDAKVSAPNQTKTCTTDATIATSGPPPATRRLVLNTTLTSPQEGSTTMTSPQEGSTTVVTYTYTTIS